MRVEWCGSNALFTIGSDGARNDTALHTPVRLGNLQPGNRRALRRTLTPQSYVRTSSGGFLASPRLSTLPERDTLGLLRVAPTADWGTARICRVKHVMVVC